MSDWTPETLAEELDFLVERLDEPATLYETEALLLLAARSSAHEMSVAVPERLDTLILERAKDLVDSGVGLVFDEDDERRKTIGERPYPPDHWWWYLDEILAGTRPRPEVG